MKMWISTALLGVLVGLFSLVSCQQTAVTEANINETLEVIERRLEWVDYRLALEEWELEAGRPSDSLDFFTRLRGELVSDDRELALLRNGRNRLSDEDDARRWKLVYPRLLRGGVEEKGRVRDLRDSLLSVYRAFRPEFESAPWDPDDLDDISLNDRNRVRREMAFRRLHSAGTETARAVERLIRLRNQEARRDGYNSYYGRATSQDELTTVEFDALVDRLDTLTAAAYARIVEEAGRSLGLERLEMWDLPHAYAVVKQEADRFFPIDSQMPIMRRTLSSMGFDLDALPIFFEIDTVRGGESMTISVNSPHDVRTSARLSSGLQSMRSLIGEAGLAVYATHVTQERAAFSRMLGDPWRTGITELFASLCDTPEWLTEYAHMPPEAVQRFLRARRDLAVIDARWTLARLRLEYEAYKNPNRNLNTVWWKLADQYLGFPRHDDIEMWAADVSLVANPARMQQRLLGKIIAAQNAAYIEKNHDGMLGAASAKSFLVQNYFRFGARYPWTELLERGVGEDIELSYLVADLGLE